MSTEHGARCARRSLTLRRAGIPLSWRLPTMTREASASAATSAIRRSAGPCSVWTTSSRPVAALKARVSSAIAAARSRSPLRCSMITVELRRAAIEPATVAARYEPGEPSVAKTIRPGKAHRPGGAGDEHGAGGGVDHGGGHACEDHPRHARVSGRAYGDKVGALAPQSLEERWNMGSADQPRRESGNLLPCPLECLRTLVSKLIRHLPGLKAGVRSPSWIPHRNPQEVAVRRGQSARLAQSLEPRGRGTDAANDAVKHAHRLFALA